MEFDEFLEMLLTFKKPSKEPQKPVSKWEKIRAYGLGITAWAAMLTLAATTFLPPLFRGKEDIVPAYRPGFSVNKKNMPGEPESSNLELIVEEKKDIIEGYETKEYFRKNFPQEIGMDESPYEFKKTINLAENITLPTARYIIRKGTHIRVSSGYLKILPNTRIILEENSKIDVDNLIIRQGVEFIFQPNSSIVVQEKIYAKGTEDNKIKFTAIKKYVPANIMITGCSDSLLEHVVVEYLQGIADHNRTSPFVIERSNIILKYCEFRENKGKSGGALYLEGKLDMDHCTFIENNADVGGAIFIGGNGFDSLIFRNGKILQNTAKMEGGGMFACNANIIFENTEISRNKASTGGGLSLRGDKGTCSCYNMQIYGNSGEDGGAISYVSCSLRLLLDSNCRLLGNTKPQINSQHNEKVIYDPAIVIDTDLEQK